MSFEKALESVSRDERFRATIYAMNTLLIHKGIYTRNEFREVFVEWASKLGKDSAREASRQTTPSA